MTQFDEAAPGDSINHRQNLINALSKLQHRGLEKVLGVQEDAAIEEAAETFFAFPIGSHHFVVNAQCFCEVFVDIAVAALPNSPHCLRGLCNVRGLLLPVYQLHSFLGETPAKKTAIFCIGKGDKAIGLLVDALPVSLALRRSDQIAATSVLKLLNELCSAAYLSSEKTWYLLDVNRLGEQLMAMSVIEQQYISKTQSTPQDTMLTG